MKEKTKRIIALALVIMLCIGVYHGVKPTANTKNESNIALTLGNSKIFQYGSVFIYRKTFSGKPGFCLDLDKDSHSMSGVVSSNMKISDQVVRKKGNISKKLNYKFAYAMEYVGEELGGKSVSMSDANYIGAQIYVWYIVGDLGYSEAVTMLSSHTEALNAFNKINTYVEKELKNASMIPSFSYESEDTAKNDNNRISIRAGKTKEKKDKNEVLSNFEISNTKGQIIKSAKISGNTLKITADEFFDIINYAKK